MLQIGSKHLMVDVDLTVWSLRVDVGRYASVSEVQCSHILCEFEIMRYKKY
jgi:hypothetical protein